MKTSMIHCLAFLALVAFAAPAVAADAPPPSREAKAVEALVNKAAAEINKRGVRVFNEFRKKDGPWFHGDTYLFVYNLEGVVLLNPAFPENEGTKGTGRARSPTNPQSFSDAFVQTAKTKGAGWVDYMYPKPGEKEVSQKWSYVKRVTIDGTPGLVGAGFYPK